MDYQKLFKGKVDRRRLLGNLGMMGAGAVITACGAGVATPQQPVQPPTTPATNLDPAILNFALNLEYLEAAFYLAAVGRLSEIQAIGGDAAIDLPEGFDGNVGIAFTDDDANIEAYANEIATDELNHVKFLRTALGTNPVADRPAINLASAFQDAAAAAFPSLGREVTDGFDPFANSLFFLHGAFIFEDVGVTAYAGAAPYITDKTTVLLKAAGILAVEAYHAGQIRTLLYGLRDTETPFGAPVVDVVAGISALRATVGGGKDQGIVVDGAANINPTDADSVAYARTPTEVANIVYLGSAATPGGFYPDGITIPTELQAGFDALFAVR